jgi:hypothetical protein
MMPNEADTPVFTFLLKPADDPPRDETTGEKANLHRRTPQFKIQQYLYKNQKARHPSPVAV